MNKKRIDLNQPFNLTKTLYSGQPPNFVFQEQEKGHIGFIRHNSRYKPIKLSQKQGKIEYKADVPKKKVKRFLGLEQDIEMVYSEINTDSYIKKLIDKYKGLRITNFNPQFTVISFIVSANNCIRNISSFISNLTNVYGEKTSIDGHTLYLPPDNNELSRLTIDDFKKLKAGYRSRYLHKTLQMLNNNEVNLQRLYKKNHEEVREQLMTLMGIGTKISDCISLFSYSNYESFPVDVNVRREMKKNYGLHDFNDSEIQNYARDRWGDYAGYAQQYIFLDAITKK
ncbi:DNA glycosylase [Methanonatronarchaeum sp. AMET6-2]|uniref:DNA glycosylase n=1 Tax=Methanonatronarchaeum sp. AMET6-2 TaxID=2933293 RepID=UPI0011FCFA7B|nr:DNA glycosylase [Methanonatronarchaeum sp. AMET6-2]RZN62921.1 MAG: hypothetical protein EF811_01700 [Methanonatronarchaeia archaeon]UOY09854.1 hypothetical protein MU439_06220 [Methanonatronarchaeum sp. AMET6-2]